jgi:methyl-accepting chemotaxis protein
MTISRVTKWLAAIIIAGYLLTLVTSNYTLDKLKVTGPIYDKIVLGKDLVADILPPPAYLIESYLLTSLALLDQMEAGGGSAADKIRAHAERLKSLENDFNARHVFWRQQILDPRLKSELVSASYQPGERFWRVVNDDFLPALLKGDTTEAKRLYGQLSDAYKAHRAAVDNAVTMANAENEATVADAAAQERLNLTLTWAVALVVLLLIVAGAAGVLLAILGPVNRIKASMAALATGASDLDVPYLTRRDEVGEMARAVEVFRQNALERGRLEAAMSENSAKDQRRQRFLDQQLLRFKETITDNLQILLNEVDDLRTTSESLLKAAGDASGEAGKSASACSVAASGSQAVAAATEELNVSIREISAQAHHTSSIVGKTTERTKDTDTEVTQLMDAVGKIETVVTLIRQIAQHTNLLALNATIESARAGEAGRGFAVVAAEVKDLSEQTAKATEDIARQIHTVQTTTESAATSIRDIGTQVTGIHNLALSVAAAVEQQQHAAADIARNVNIVSDGSNRAAESSRIVTQVAEQTGLEAKKLAAASNQLQGVSAAVSRAVQEFIDSVSRDLEERRKSARQPIERAVTLLKNGERLEARTGNVSVTGMKIGRVGNLKRGDAVQVEVGSSYVKAKVVWDEAGYCGLQFTQPVSEAQLVAAGLLRNEGAARAA